jgi:hypothetical protein
MMSATKKTRKLKRKGGVEGGGAVTEEACFWF